MKWCYRNAFVSSSTSSSSSSFSQMAETNDRTSRSHEGDADDMSFLLHHLLSSSSTPNPISSDKGKEIPLPFPHPSQTSDAALALAARRAVGLNPHSGYGWDIFCHVKTLPDDDLSRPSQPHLSDRDRTASTAESSAAPLVRPYSGEMKESRRSSFVDSSADCDAASAAAKRRKAPSSSAEADFDEYECESEVIDREKSQLGSKIFFFSSLDWFDLGWGVFVVAGGFGGVGGAVEICFYKDGF